MPEEIIFDENIKGKVQVESLSELEDYVEHENVKRNATITKITRTIGKIIILFTERQSWMLPDLSVQMKTTNAPQLKIN